jgi:hypothetical protein
LNPGRLSVLSPLLLCSNRGVLCVSFVVRGTSILAGRTHGFFLVFVMAFEAYLPFILWAFLSCRFAFDLACIHHSGEVRYHYSSELLLLIICIFLLFVIHTKACHVMLIPLGMNPHASRFYQLYGCCMGLLNDIRSQTVYDVRVSGYGVPLYSLHVTSLSL